MSMKQGSGGGSMSCSHSPMGKLSVESSTTPVSSGIAKERTLGITVPKAVNRPKKK